MTLRQPILAAALSALMPATAFAARETLRGSPASMIRQHDVAVEEELTFYRTPAAVLAEVEAGTLTPLEGNDDYQIANVSFAYAVPEVRLFVERLASQYRNACAEPLVVTSLTRPRAQQPRNAHALSVHPAGMAVDLRVSESVACRTWLERTLLSLEASEVLDVTRERMPPHYHVAVFPTPYREYVDDLEAAKQVALAATVENSTPPAVTQAAVAAMPIPRGTSRRTWALAPFLVLALAALGAARRRRAAG